MLQVKCVWKVGSEETLGNPWKTVSNRLEHQLNWKQVMIETAIDAALYFMSFMLFPCRVLQEKSEEFDTVLLAIGRTGEAQKLGLAEAGVPWTFWTDA